MCFQQRQSTTHVDGDASGDFWLGNARITSKPETSRRRLIGRQSERHSGAAETSTAIWHNIAQLQ
jgi:hypothetical protein